MTLPQDARAPHRQQRWIALENVGATTIPPFGVVEIVESHRPESGGLVPGDGPTVVKVRRPTIDSLPHFYVNGPVEIPVGKTGQPGTNDFPCMAAYEQQYVPVTGHMWGTIKDSYLIGRGRQGVAIVGDADSSLGIVRVNRAERLIRVTPYSEALMPGGTVECTVLAWSGSQWLPTNTRLLVTDPFFRTCAFTGEEFWCEAYGGSYQTVSEFGLRRRGIVIQDSIQNNSSGLVAFTSITPPPSASCTGNRIGPIVDACYRTPSGASLQVNDELFVHYHAEFRRWFVLPVGGSSVIHFEMRGPLPLGGQGIAIEIGTGPAYPRIGSNFPIKDSTTNNGRHRYDPSGSSQFRGYMGWCVIPPNPEMYQGEPVREIITMENIARSIEFVLTSDIQGTYGEATITNYYLDGKNPAETDLMTGSTIRVYDSQKNYQRALEGAKGKARYNDRDHQYEIVECNQMAFMIKATCSEMCPDAGSTSVADYEAMTFAPFGQKPKNVSSAENVNGLSHEGEARDTLVWNESLEQWEVLQVPHVPDYLVTSTEISAGGCSIGILSNLKKYSVMTCGEIDTDTDQIGFTSKDVVTGVEKIECSIRTTKERVCVLIPDDEVTSNSDIAFTAMSVLTNVELNQDQGECKLVGTLEDICVLQPDGAQPAEIDLLEFTAQLVVQYVEFADGCFNAQTALLYVPCFEEGDLEEIACGDPCPDSQSSSPQ